MRWEETADVKEVFKALRKGVVVQAKGVDGGCWANISADDAGRLRWGHPGSDYLPVVEDRKYRIASAPRRVTVTEDLEYANYTDKRSSASRISKGFGTIEWVVLMRCPACGMSFIDPLDDGCGWECGCGLSMVRHGDVLRCTGEVDA